MSELERSSRSTGSRTTGPRQSTKSRIFCTGNNFMPLYITEYSYLAKDLDGNLSRDIPKGPGLNHTAYAITTASRSSATFQRSSRFIVARATTACVFATGASPDVSVNNGNLIPANVNVIFGIDETLTSLMSFKMFV